MVKVGLNGFNEVARTIVRMAAEKDTNVTVVCINHKNAETQHMAYQLRYSSAYGRMPGRVYGEEQAVVIGNTKIGVTVNGNFPEDCDVVIDCENDGALQWSGKTVFSGIGENAVPVDFGINHHTYKNEKAVAQVNPETSAIALLSKVINGNFGIENAVALTLKPGDTSSNLSDCGNSVRWRNGRSADSVIPEVCGGAQGTGLILPELGGVISGIAFRTPVKAVSTVELVCALKNSTSYGEVAEKIKQAAEGEFGGLLGVTDDSPVSCDFVGCPLSVVADLRAGILQGERLLTVTGWYDGVWSHSAKLLKLAEFMGS